MNGEHNVGWRSWLWILALLAWTVPGTPAQTSKPVPEVPRPDFEGRTAHPVDEVVSGDTVVVLIDDREARVELIGVNAPAKSEPGYELARTFLHNLLAGESVYLEIDGEQSDDGDDEPLRAYVYRAPDGLFANLEIVRQGYGRVPVKEPFKHRELFEFYQHKAHEAAKGIWQPPEEQGAGASRAPRKQPSSQPAPQARDITVYVTRTGKKYHLRGCSHLRRSSIPLSLSEAKRRGYTPCSHCKPPE